MSGPRPDGEGAPTAALTAFAALAAFASLHWATLVEQPQLGRVLLCVVVATAGGAALALLGGRPAGKARAAAAAGLGALTLLAGFAAAGLSVRLLGPRRWDDLYDGLDRGLAGLRTASWPYAGAEEWVRLTLLLLIPLIVGVAAVLAFWPAAAGRTVRRFAALTLLIGLFAAADAERAFGLDVLRGVVLLVLVAAWLWLPRLRPRDVSAAAAAVAIAAVAAVPVAARVDEDRPAFDYENWSIWGAEDRGGQLFDWEHAYGPIVWQRTGQRMLNVRSREAHYWKVKTLDEFDGLRWIDRAIGGVGEMELPPPEQRDPRWERRIEMTVRGLRSPVVVGAGTILTVEGAGPYQRAPEGTVRLLRGPLEKGDSYAVRAYVPDPSAAQMRAAPDPSVGMEVYTRLWLPAPGESATGEAQLGQRDRSPVTGVELDVPAGLWGGAVPLDEVSRIKLENSPYARTFRLARRLAAGAETPYDAVRRIERHLRTEYEYTEQPPARPYPLEDFLFTDKAGYCQQFSGAMALMLRMNGIPARVATGFSPGIYDPEKREYRVRDFDAHSWVEVHFEGIGWVPFDPTPAAAPAQLQSADVEDDDDSASNPGRAGQSPRAPDIDTGGDPETAAGGGGGGPAWWTFALGGLTGLALIAGGLALLAARRGARAVPALDRDVAELRAALVRLGYELPPAATLSTLERRLGAVAGPGAARYLRRLRERRFAPAGRSGPDRLDRRALRRALTRGGGPLRRLRGFLALPPEPLRPRS